jgi:hypothetical protein
MDRMKVITRKHPIDHRTRKVFLWSLIVGVVLSGLAFALKVAQFIHSMSSEAARGFADVPVTVYFFVAGGWFCLLAWCLITGKFRNMESAKLEMLKQEEEYERQGL